MSDVLRLSQISKAYNKGKSTEVPVLSDVDLIVAEGEIVALVAPSGAGKSTLLHIAGLLDAADSGEVQIKGQDMHSARDRARTRVRRQEVGFVYQFHHLLQEFTAVENIVLPQLADGVSWKQAEAHAEDLLGRVGMSARMQHRPAELSGGEQQRVAFCRALANKPALLLADEPTGNLDPATSETVFQTLMDLVKDTGMSAVVATHNHDLAAKMDRTLHLQAGQLV